MIRIRFHGRGGHGVKTASRIAGTAAFTAGKYVQDSPIYGAERRGAPVRSFTRVGDEPILERGDIVKPDLIVLADPSLLHDPAAGVLSGQEFASAVFINASAPSAEEMTKTFEIHPRVAALDLTHLTLEALGRASALSAGLGAAAIRLTALASRDDLITAVQDELNYLRVEPGTIKKNQALAISVFDALPEMELDFTPRERPAAQGVHRMTYEEPLRSSPSILLTGNAEAKHTGSWRVETPEIDYDRCLRCGLCLVRCPDGAIQLDENGYPVIDYEHCKGCMICQDICPVSDGIRTRKETEAW